MRPAGLTSSLVTRTPNPPWESPRLTCVDAVGVYGERGATQGHSKNPAGDDGDGFGAVLAEVFSRFPHGETTGADEGQCEVADRDERTAAGADAAAILVHRDVAHVVQPVLDAPVGTDERQQPVGPALAAGKLVTT